MPGDFCSLALFLHIEPAIMICNGTCGISSYTYKKLSEEVHTIDIMYTFCYDGGPKGDDEYEMYSRSPNRKKHIPYIFKVLIIDNPERIGDILGGNMDIGVKRIGRELKYEGRIVDFYADTVELPDGRTAVWDYIEHRKGAAAVVAVRPDGKLLMVRQYRNAIGRVSLEIPAGARDTKEEPYEVCAARELEEETGYRCDKLEFLISIHSTVAFCNERIDIYVARDLVPAGQHLDFDEFVEVEACSLEELCRGIYEGKIQDAKTIAAIMAYKNKYQL